MRPVHRRKRREGGGEEEEERREGGEEEERRGGGEEGEERRRRGRGGLEEEKRKRGEERRRRLGAEEERKKRTRGREEEEEEEEAGYLDDVSDRQEVSSREDVVFVLLFFTLPHDDVNMRRRSCSCIQLLLLLSTGNHLSVTSPLFNTTLFHSVNEHQNKIKLHLIRNKLIKLPLNTLTPRSSDTLSNEATVSTTHSVPFSRRKHTHHGPPVCVYV